MNDVHVRRGDSDKDTQREDHTKTQEKDTNKPRREAGE